MNVKEIGCELDSPGSGQSPLISAFEHGNGVSGSIKSGVFLDQLSDCQIFKRDCASWS
jgi:hypothetical protein